MTNATVQIGRGYPHLIIQEAARDERFEIRVANDPLPGADRPAAFRFSGPGAVDGSGQVTAAGRALVVAGVRTRLGAQEAACVVWAPDSCTWLMVDGGEMEGRHPPRGEPGDSGDWRHLPVRLVPGSSIKLPAGCASTHLFLRRLCDDRVEVSSAEPMHLAYWDEPPRDDETDPLEGCFAEDGTFTPPARYRGVEVTRVTDEALLGPVQPDGRRRSFVTPWPGAVAAACCEVAGLSLPTDLLATAWHAVENDLGQRTAEAA